MIPMRQRVLLVAGWVVAAVLTTVVASGAVTVAAGQVSDQPLAPLSVAEVTALPVVDTSGQTDPCEPGPLPPAARDCRIELSTEGAQSEGPEDNDLSGPAGGGEGVDLGIGGASFPRAQVITGDGSIPLDAGPTTEPPFETAIVSVEGGSVSVAASDGEVWLLWAIARPGFAVERSDEEDGSLRITFSRESEQSGVNARWTEDGLVVESFAGIR